MTLPYDPPRLPLRVHVSVRGQLGDGSAILHTLQTCYQSGGTAAAQPALGGRPACGHEGGEGNRGEITCRDAAFSLLIVAIPGALRLL